jgi:TonB family protein
MPGPSLAARALAAALAAAAASCSPYAGAQHTYARFLTPVKVRPGAPAPQPVTQVLTLRAYADADYRAHAADWRERIAEQVGRANAILAADFGVRLELEPVREWERSSGRDAHLGATLGALRRQDDARDVDWVVGFVSPAAEDSGREHDLIGWAGLFGSHFVLRAMQTSADVARIDHWYDELEEGERQAFAKERRVHKEVATFLHEWGHTVGAVHECDSKWIMTPEYSVISGSFSSESIRLVRVGLAHRRRDGAPPKVDEPWATAWRAEAARMQGAAWECTRLEEGLARADAVLRERLSAAARPEPAREALERYADEVRRAVSSRVTLPPDALPQAKGEPPRVALELRLDRAGAVKLARVDRSSGIAAFDDDVLRSVRAAPFAPPPAALCDGDGDLVLHLVVHLR